jgi:hypothetical protein
LTVGVHRNAPLAAPPRDRARHHCCASSKKRSPRESRRAIW